MPRNTPCRACKKRQKRCQWPEHSNVCGRCAQYNLECVVLDRHQDLNISDDDVTPREFVHNSFEYWNHQVEQLKNQLIQAEQIIQQCPGNSHSNNLNNSAKSFKKPAKQQQHMEWELTVENGRLKLHTPITSMEELLFFRRASLRYLSPFQDLFEESPSAIRFENTFVLTATFRAFRNLFTHSIQPNLLLLSSQQQEKTQESIRDIMDQLVHVYLKYKNPKHALLHTPTFLDYYQSLEDPLSCPITLALCVDTISTTRRLDGLYTSTERHQLAWYFYESCKNILGEMFDDPHRKFETVITITFLKHYIMFVLLQPQEARRLITIAYILCKELEQEDTFADGDSVARIILQRLNLQLERTLNIIHVMSGGTVFKHMLSVTALHEKLPDEDEMTGLFVEMNNRLISLSNNFYMRVVTKPQNGTELGSNGLTLEAIIRCDEAIKEWWATTPSYLRLCDDLYTDNVLLLNDSDWIKGVVFCFAHVSIMQTYACLVKPIALGDSITDNNMNQELLASLRGQAKQTIFRSCDLLLNVMIQMLSKSEDMPSIAMFEITSRAMPSLLTVSASTVPIEVHHKLYQCIRGIHALFPSDTHTVHPSLSPLNELLATSQRQADFTVYQNYPLPGYALFADILNISCAHLQSHFGSKSCLDSVTVDIAK